MKDKKIDLRQRYGFLVINGKYFKDTSKDGQTMWVPANQKTIKKLEKMSKDIAEKLQEALDRKTVLVESIMRMTQRDIERLHNIVFNAKRKYKAKTRKHRCVDMKVGGFILPIVE